jgi:MFS transporter, SP family, xylose:H+ symportor
MAEVYPQSVRAIGMSVSVTVNWVTQLIVSATFLSLVSSMGALLTFSMYAVVCVLAIVWIWFQVPETKDKSLEQLADELSGHNNELPTTILENMTDEDEKDVELEEE